MPRRVDNVDSMIIPESCSCRRGDGDSPLLLLLHPVHGGGPFVNFTHTVDSSRIVEDTLGGGGLPCINVSKDANISDFI